MYLSTTNVQNCTVTSQSQSIYNNHQRFPDPPKPPKPSIHHRFIITPPKPPPPSSTDISDDDKQLNSLPIQTSNMLFDDGVNHIHSLSHSFPTIPITTSSPPNTNTNMHLPFTKQYHNIQIQIPMPIPPSTPILSDNPSYSIDTDTHSQSLTSSNNDNITNNTFSTDPVLHHNDDISLNQQLFVNSQNFDHIVNEPPLSPFISSIPSPSERTITETQFEFSNHSQIAMDEQSLMVHSPGTHRPHFDSLFHVDDDINTVMGFGIDQTPATFQLNDPVNMNYLNTYPFSTEPNQMSFSDTHNGLDSRSGYHDFRNPSIPSIIPNAELQSSNIMPSIQSPKVPAKSQTQIQFPQSSNTEATMSEPRVTHKQTNTNSSIPSPQVMNTNTKKPKRNPRKRPRFDRNDNVHQKQCNAFSEPSTKKRRPSSNNSNTRIKGNEKANKTESPDSEQRHQEKQKKRMELRIKFLDEFKESHDGLLPTLRGIMKLCSCGNEKAKQTISTYAQTHEMTVKEVKEIMKVRNDNKGNKNKSQDGDNTSIIQMDNESDTGISTQLRNHIHDILRSKQPGNSNQRAQNAQQYVAKLYDLVKQVEKVDKLRFTTKLLLRESRFIIGVWYGDYKSLLDALDESHDLSKDGRVNEEIFPRIQYDAFGLLPQICSVYASGARLLAQNQEIAFAQDVVQLLRNLVRNMTPNNIEQRDIIKDTKQFIRTMSIYLQSAPIKDQSAPTEKPVEVRLRSLNIKESEISKTSDGDLFEAISDQIYGDTKHGKTIQQQCALYMKSKFDRFATLILDGKKGIDIKTFDNYCNGLIQDKSQGGLAEIIALSDIYGRVIEVYSKDNDSENNNKYKQIWLQKPDKIQRKLAIKLIYNKASNHYDSIIPEKHTFLNSLCVGLEEGKRIDRKSLVVYHQVLLDTLIIDQENKHKLIE